MPLLAVLDETAHGALDDSLKTLYKQNTENKNFYLDIAPDEAAKVAFGLQADVKKKEDLLKKAHEEKRAAEAKAGLFDTLGKTPDEIKELIESKRPEDIQKLIETHRTELETVKRSYEEPIATATQRAERAERQAMDLMARTKIQELRNQYDLNDTADYVLRDFIKVVPVEETGEFAVKVFENGQPALVAGQEMTPDQLVKSFQEAKKFPAMFNVSDGAGTGTNRFAGPNNGKQYEGLSPVEKLNLAREQGVKT